MGEADRLRGRAAQGADWNVGAAYTFSPLAACAALVLLVVALFRVGIIDIAR